MRVLDFLTSGETPICLADAAKLLPAKPNGKHLSLRAMERYIREGYGPTDSKVFLEGAKAANLLCTSREAVQRFVLACTVADQHRHQLPPEVAKKPAAPKTRSRGRGSSRARRELEQAGWGKRSGKARGE